VLKRFEQIAKQQMLDEQARDLADFGVRFDRWFSEQSLYDAGAVQATLELLKTRGYAYEHEGALWLKSTVVRRRERPRAGACERDANLLGGGCCLPPRQVRARLRPDD
jgi:arginyl-tRNA synthetase